ncbi:MAG TPA: hypothetical protein HA255_01805 [Methanosphaera sp.]|nr:hypothetical protein [Methanosphaera sp.]
MYFIGKYFEIIFIDIGSSSYVIKAPQNIYMPNIKTKPHGITKSDLFNINAITLPSNIYIIIAIIYCMIKAIKCPIVGKVRLKSTLATPMFNAIPAKATKKCASTADETMVKKGTLK